MTKRRNITPEQAQKMMMEDKNSSIHVMGVDPGMRWKSSVGLNLPDYNTSFAYNAQKGLTARSDGRSDPYIWDSPDNQYGYFVLKLLLASSTMQRCFRNASNIAFGSGFHVSGDELEVEEFNEWMRTISGANSIEFHQNLLQSFAGFGGAYGLLSYSPSSSGPALNGVRMGKPYSFRRGKPDEEGDIAYNWTHPDFSKAKLLKSKLRGYPQLPEGGVESNAQVADAEVVDCNGKSFYKGAPKGRGRFSLFVRTANLFSEWLSRPLWESNAVVNAAMIEDAMFSGDLAGLENGLTATHIIFLAPPYISEEMVQKERKNAQSGKPESMAETRERLRREEADRISESWVGAENKGRAIVVMKDPRSKGDVVEIATIPTHNGKDMQELIRSHALKAIYTGWGVTDPRLVAGQPEKTGSLADQAGQLLIAEQLWYQTVLYPDIVAPAEEFLRKALLRPFMRQTNKSATSLKLGYGRVRLALSLPSDAIQREFYTSQEIRQFSGHGPLSEEQQEELYNRNNNPK